MRCRSFCLMTLIKKPVQSSAAPVNTSTHHKKVIDNYLLASVILSLINIQG